MVVWLSGALGWWNVAATRLWRFQRFLRQSRSAPADVQEQARRLAALLRLRRCPPVVFVSAPLSPMLWALGLSPRLLVPAELWRKLTAEQQDTLLAHELAHLWRGDHWVRRLELLVLGLYWWYPVVWWARRRLQEAEEECCDALVVAVLPDAAPAYASALVETVTFLSQSRPAALVGASGAGHVPLLKRRLTMILTETSLHKPSRLAFWTVLGLGALLLPLAPQAARTEAPEEPKQEELKVPIDDWAKAQIENIAILHTREIFKAKDCIACHQPVLRDRREFHGKPQSWREAHDEIVRLLKELDSRQAQLREAAKRQPTSAEPDRSQEMEKLQDEIELLKVRVRLKEARVEASRKMLEEHRRRLANYKSVNQRQPGTIPQDTIQDVQLAITTHETQLKINEADIQEPLVRLKQAERRLARLRRPEPRPNTTVFPNQLEPQMVLVPQSGWNITWAEAMFINNRKVDLGTVRHGTIVDHDFRITNHGQRTAHIASIRTSAGCLSAVPTKVELPPGESAAIHTRLDASRFTGSKTFMIYVQLDKPDRQEVVLEIQANSQPAAPRKPQSPERLQELEKKLDALRKEMENLRREMQPDKPRVPGSPPDGAQK